MKHKVVFFTIISWIWLNVCADPCNNHYGGCDPYNGLCWATGTDTHFCTCVAGYKDAGYDFFHYCVDVDECVEEDVCSGNAECENTDGSYKCTCHCGYIMDYTGQHCLAADRITDLCEIPAQCYHKDVFWREYLGAVDFDTRYGKWYRTDTSEKITIDEKVVKNEGRCKCEPGFTENSCGYCVDYDECQFDNPCSGFQSTCTNTEGSYYCACNPGYILGPCGKRCYRPTQTVPDNCGNMRDLSAIASQGVSEKNFAKPITLLNWRTCATGVNPGDTTLEKYDTDHDKVIDLRLTWVCSVRRRQQTSELKLVTEEEARWEDWTCWTACKATCWGGVQTRVRKCLFGLPGLEGCPGEGSQKRECYKGKKCKFRVRKDANTLSKREKEDLMQAMDKYKKDKSVKGFFNAAAAHGWPSQCNRRSCCPHGAKMKFLAWHRTILLNYEEGLNRYLKDKSIGLPYWNWLGTKVPDLAMSKELEGRENPFTNMTIRIDGPMTTIQRDDEVFEKALERSRNTWVEIASKFIRPHTMQEFSEALESAHNGPHVSICGKGKMSDRCRLSMASLYFAGFDPMFMMHHTQVDRLWALAQLNMDTAGNTTWSPQTALEVLEDRGDFSRRHSPFRNKTINAFPIVQAVNTMRDSYYYEELTGVKYDYLGGNGFPRVSQRKISRRNIKENLFIAHYLQSVEENVHINYYALIFGDDVPCIHLDDSLLLANTMIQGTDRTYRNAVPRLLSLLNILGTSGLDEDLLIKACYTRLADCRSNCEEATSERIASMPSPGLVHYIPNQPIDVYKFQWGAGLRTPHWYINLDAQSQWLFFYGDRASNVVQVQSYDEWTSCNSTTGRAVKCFTNACILPSGVYFLIDKDASHCEAGLKMLVISRK